MFRLASGKMSRYYVDCKQALSDPEARGLIGQIAANMIGERSYDAIGGLELGAYPIAISISDGISKITFSISPNTAVSNTTNGLRSKRAWSIQRRNDRRFASPPRRDRAPS